MTNQDTDNEEITLATLASEYSDNDKARALLESIRWPNGITCPHCNASGHYVLKPRASSKVACRNGLYKCKTCWRQFTVTVGTIFEDSKIPLGKWLMAFFILGSSKKAVSSHQLHRMLGVTYKTAWFMSHRIRHAMNPHKPLGRMLKGTVEVDETYFGKRSDVKRAKSSKSCVAALVERGGEPQDEFGHNSWIAQNNDYLTPPAVLDEPTITILPTFNRPGFSALIRITADNLQKGVVYKVGFVMPK
jgi:transposase-like protein